MLIFVLFFSLLF